MTRMLIQETTFEVHAKHLRGQGRPRFTKTGHAYKADEDKAWEQRIRDAYSAACQYKDMAGFADEVGIEIRTYRRLPSDRPKSVEEEPDIYKGDADNYAKSVLDALSKLAFMDDKQVTHLEVTKMPRRRFDSDEVMKITIKYYSEVNAR